MVKNFVVIKDIYREILKTRGRFLGIFAIVALGVAFYSGLGATGTDMKLTGDSYFTDRRLMDIRVVSNYGFNANDIEALKNAPGVGYLYAGRSVDALVSNNGYTANVKLLSFDTRAEINKPVLISGELPNKTGECAVEAGFLSRFRLSIGDSVTFTSGKTDDIRNQLRSATLKITGTVKSPLYIALERGASSIGRGETDFFLLAHEDNFLSEIYTDAFILVEGAERFMCFDDGYAEAVEAVIETIESIGKTRGPARDGEMTETAYAKIRANEQNLDLSRTQSALLLDEASESIADLSSRLSASFGETAFAFPELSQADLALSANFSEIVSAIGGIGEISRELNARENELHELKHELIGYLSNYLYFSSFGEMRARIAEIEAGIESIKKARRTLDENENGLLHKLNEIEEGRRKIAEASAGAYAAAASLASGSLELYEKKNDLSAQINEAEADLNKSSSLLSGARKTLDGLNEPKWYALDRGSNPGYASYADDTDKISAIGQVFPLIFFIVAALVCLTSMTRLVEEKRTEIGTLKALGYPGFTIIAKYLIYAVIPTVAGGLVGGYAGMKLFPSIIIQAYNMLYSTPPPVTPMHYGLWAAGISMGLASTGLAAFFACAGELRQNPSTLLRVKAPRPGKRNALERFTLLWRRLGFIQKVTVRNLFRYKKRFFMTVLGIGGCAALLVTGFGLKDSIVDIVEKQFNELNLYNMVVSFGDSAVSKDVDAAYELLAGSGLSVAGLPARQKMMDAYNTAGGGLAYQATVIVPAYTDRLEDFFSFRDRATRRSHILSDDGVIITEKLAKLLGLSAGDSIFIKDGSGNFAEARVDAVTETYFMHFIYMTPALYRSCFGSEPELNAIYAVLADDASAESRELARKLLDLRGTSGVSFVRSMINSFNNIIKNLNFVVYVLIISAGALAFVVLLNLTNINISERLRELATIEVLGFYDAEVAAYVYRENAILTLIGAAFGLLAGYFLHLYVILTVETDIMMFGRDIKTLSYLYSVILTFAFAAAVNVITAGKLRKINMVEALKSGE